MILRLLVFALLCLVSMFSAVAAQELHVLGAGSLREVTAEIGKRYLEATGTTVVANFGPSGLLRERIEKGKHADLFASADMGHPSSCCRIAAQLVLRCSRAIHCALSQSQRLV
jgi:molybdate transport system substrate-binding protein